MRSVSSKMDFGAETGLLQGCTRRTGGWCLPQILSSSKSFKLFKESKIVFFFFFFFPVPGGLLDPSSPTRDRTWLETVKAWSPSEWTVGIPSAKHFFKTRRGQSLAVCCKRLGVGILCSCRSGHLFLWTFNKTNAVLCSATFYLCMNEVLTLKFRSWELALLYISGYTRLFFF